MPQATRSRCAVYGREEIDRLAYSGNNHGCDPAQNSTGDWMLDSDPALPLDQAKVTKPWREYAALGGAAQAGGSDLPSCPKRALHQMTLPSARGKTLALTVDQLNTVADVYYVYDESGAAYTVMRSDLATPEQVPAGSLQGADADRQDADDVVSMQVNDLTFTQTDASWTLTDDPAIP